MQPRNSDEEPDWDDEPPYPTLDEVLEHLRISTLTQDDESDDDN